MKKVVIALAICELSVSGSCFGMNSVWNSIENATNCIVKKIESVKNNVGQKPVVQKIKSVTEAPICKSVIMGIAAAIGYSSLTYFLEKKIKAKDIFIPFVWVTSFCLEMNSSKKDSQKKETINSDFRRTKAESSALRPRPSSNSRNSGFAKP